MNRLVRAWRRTRVGWPWLAIVAVAGFANGQPPLPKEAGFTRADAPWSWNFPRDHGSHPRFQTEWWYFTGALHDDDGRPFGFELTFFRFALRPDAVASNSDWRARDLVLAHLAVTDPAGRRFFADETVQRAAAGLAGAATESLRVWSGDWQVSGGEHGFALSASAPSHGVTLRAHPQRSPVLHGEEGLSYKSQQRDHASYYYSHPRMDTLGTIDIEGAHFEVRGTTWMDHEFFTGDTPAQGIGWDWFSARLDDGRDLMLYIIRYPDGREHASGTLVAADGSWRPLDVAGITATPLAHWSSETSGARYPIEWRLELPSENAQLNVQSQLPQQEITGDQSVGFSYWEGLCRYTGRWAGQPVVGEGYVELTGYAPNSP